MKYNIVEIGLEKQRIVRELQARINRIHGMEKPLPVTGNPKFRPFSDAFPARVFPTGAIHEFISDKPADAAATAGFIAALTGKLMDDAGLCLWIGNGRKVFPSGIKHFGVEPDRILFIDIPNPRLIAWVIEEALKCEALTAVIGEVRELDFTMSRRLQLAVEQSGVNGFVHRYQPRSENATACTTRWRITPLPSMAEDGLPGVGHSCWDVQLLKVRNGRPKHWQVDWHNGQFTETVHRHATKPAILEQQTG